MQWITSLIHKSSDKTSVKNYRPISLLCVLSNVLERIVQYDKINFEFTIWCSTLQQLLFVQASVYKTQTDVVYLGIRKAFDSVPHTQRLLSKLWTTEYNRESQETV